MSKYSIAVVGLVSWFCHCIFMGILIVSLINMKSIDEVLSIAMSVLCWLVFDRHLGKWIDTRPECKVIYLGVLVVKRCTWIIALQPKTSR